MSLVLEVPPPQATEVAVQTLAQLIAEQGLHSDIGPGPVTMERAAIALPHKVYALGLDDIVARYMPTERQFTAWRFHIHDGNRPLALLDVDVVEDDGNFELSSISEGSLVQEVESVIEVVERTDRVMHGEYYPRMLEVPALNCAILWLNALHDDLDVFLPLYDAVPGLEPRGLYTWETIQHSLIDPAEQLLRMEATGRRLEA